MCPASVGFDADANAGWRNLEDRDGKVRLAVDNWAPRLGIVWDVKGDGRSKLYANFGRYFKCPQLIQFTAFAGASALFWYNFDPIPGAFAPDPASPQSSFLFGGDSALVAPGIKGQYMDEWLLGFERDLGRHVIVGVTGHSRRLGRIIEDVNAGNGDYLFGNPGEGSASTLAFMDGSSVPSPRPERRNSSLEVTARKRLSRGWQFLGSYVVTRLRGNYDATQSHANFNSNFDWADFVVNASGPLTAESVQQAKLNGVTSSPVAPLGSTWVCQRTGTRASRRTRTFSPLTTAVGRYHLVARGTAGRNYSDFGLDLHASYPIRVGKTIQVRVQGDVFDPFNRQAILSYDQRYNRFIDGPCGGVPDAFCNGDGGLATQPGTLVPLGAITDPRHAATNPDYLTKGFASANRGACGSAFA